MARMLIVMAAIAFSSISICGADPMLEVWQAEDHQNDAAFVLTGRPADARGAAAPSGVLYLCADDAAEEEAPPAEEEKPEPGPPGVDRTWNVVMYG
jgi:hypothetical protein